MWRGGRVWATRDVAAWRALPHARERALTHLGRPFLGMPLATRVAHGLARAAFGASLLLSGVATWVACATATAVLPQPRARRACRLACKACWTASVRALPWIRLGPPLPRRAAWDAFVADASAGRGALLLLNHASPMDPLFFVAAAPARVVALPLRVLVHARHFRVPLFGGICRMCGHFPVHFTSTAGLNGGGGGSAADGAGSNGGGRRRVVKELQARPTRHARMRARQPFFSPHSPSRIVDGMIPSSSLGRGARSRPSCCRCATTWPPAACSSFSQARPPLLSPRHHLDSSIRGGRSSATEGRVSAPGCASTLSRFHAGALGVALASRAPVWGLLQAGTDACAPPDARLGGLPCRVAARRGSAGGALPDGDAARPGPVAAGPR